MNTHGENPEEVTPELIELLQYIENSTEDTAQACTSEQIHKLHERIQAIKSSEEVGVKYMQEWEERELDRREARDAGKAEGKAEGIKALVETCKDFGLTQDNTAAKLAEKFVIPLAEAENFVKLYWN